MTAQLIGEALLIAVIAAVGAAVLRMGLQRLSLSLTIMFSGLVGVLAITLTSIVTLSLGQSNSTGYVAVLSLAVVVVSLVVAGRRSTARPDLLAVLGSAVVAAGLTVGIGILVAPILTFDSWRFIEYGSSIFGDGSTVNLLLERYLGNYPIALTSLQGLADEAGISFLASGTAAIGVLGVAGAFELIRPKWLRGRPWLRLPLVVIVIVVVAASAYMTRLQLGYVNSHAMTAGYYSMGIAALFGPGIGRPRFSSDEEPLRARVLGLSCAGLALGRVEGLLLVGLVLVSAVAFRGWSRRSLALIALLGLLLPAIWYGRLAASLVESDILSPSRTVVLLLVAIAPLVAAMVSKPGRPVPLLASATVLALGVATFVVASTNAEGMGVTAGHLVLNLAATGLWGAMWWVVLPVAVMAVVRMGDANERSSWLVVTMGFVLVTLLLGGIREVPYAARWGDSGNRMMIHVLPAFFLMIFRGFADRAAREPTKEREMV